jgi:antitoxin CptB
MTGSQVSSDSLDPRRRRALFRAWHRGTREMDLLLGRFADAHIGNLSDHDLADFEALIELPDGDLFDVITGSAPVAAPHRTQVLNAVISFHADKRRD